MKSGARPRRTRPAKPALRRIFVVFKTHFDMGFTGLLDEVLHAYTHVMVPQALEACRLTLQNELGHRYVWTLPAWPLAHALRALDGGAQGQELSRRVKEGLIAWHALPLTTHTELFGLEDLIRGLYVARRLRDRFGRAAAAAKMTDVPGHTWILPELLAAAGVSFLHLGCNPCSTPPDVPLLFRWEGPGGTGVTTMYSQGGYGTPLLPPPEWTLPLWLALQLTNDNAGPQRAEIVPEILQTIGERSPGTEVVFGSLDDFARALAELAPDLPVVRRDLADSWIHGAGTMPREVAALRGARNRLVQLESRAAMQRLAQSAAATDISANVAAAYEKLLLFGEHTWGMDTKLALNPPERGGRVYDKDRFREVKASGRYGRIERSWDDKRKLATDAQRIVRDIERSEGGSEGEVMALPGRLEIFNHQLWEWSGPVRLGRFADEVSVTGELDGGRIASFSLDGETWAVPKGVPPLGCRRLLVEKAAEGAPVSAGRRATVKGEARRLTVENGRVRVRVNGALGGVESLVDLSTGREWVDRSGGVPFGAYRYDVYSRREIAQYLKAYAFDLEHWFLDDFGKPGYPDRPHETHFGKLDRVERGEGPGWARLRLDWQQDAASTQELGNAARVTQTITLLDDRPWVDLRYDLEGKEECPLLEAGHVVMPLACARPRYAISKTGTVVDPASDIAADANRLLHCCDRWVDVADEKGGVLVIPLDSPLFSIGSPAIERFDGDAKPGRPVLFFNLFNTQWGTNFPQWIRGDLSFRFRLVPHPGNWRRARAWEHAAAALQPPLCLPASPAGSPPGLLARPATGLETVTLKRCETGDGLILRLREPAGRAGRRTLHFRVAAGSRSPRVSLCSLLEDEREALGVSRLRDTASVTLSVRPFEVITLKVTA